MYPQTSALPSRPSPAPVHERVHRLTRVVKIFYDGPPRARKPTTWPSPSRANRTGARARSPAALSRPPVRIGGRPGQLRLHLDHILRVEQSRGIADGLREGAPRRSEHRTPARHRFNRRQTESLEQRRKHHGAGRAIPVGQIILRPQIPDGGYPGQRARRESARESRARRASRCRQRPIATASRSPP